VKPNKSRMLVWLAHTTSLEMERTKPILHSQ